MNFTLRDLLELIKNSGSGILENSKGLDNVFVEKFANENEHRNKVIK